MNPHRHFRPSTAPRPRHEQGFVLVLALVLLLVLTTLAVSGVTSSALQFTIAGNAQQHSGAFQAAETGLAFATVNGSFDPTVPAQVMAQGVPNSPTDSYRVTIAPALNGAPQPSPPGNSVGTFVTYLFDVSSVGQSVRGSSTTHAQGMQVLSPQNPSTPCNVQPCNLH
jgi:Tfp pilus assembly protein PilX